MKSERFAGYNVDYSRVSGRTFQDILGFWTVPTVQSSQNASASLEFLGVDLDSGTGVQIGTSQLSENGTVYYRAFYAVFPDNLERPVVIKSLNGEVGPGTVIGADMNTGIAGNWTLSILIMNRGFIATDSFATSLRRTTHAVNAEWSVGRVVGLPLANFTSVDFLDANATVSGQEYMLNDFSNSRVTLADKSSGCFLAIPGKVALAVPAFRVAFVRAGPPCNVLGTAPQPPIDFQTPFILGSSVVGGLLIGLAATTIYFEGGRRIRRQHGPTTSPSNPVTASRLSCPKCGHILHPNAGFCDTCGTEIDHKTETLVKK